jgi:hypothetical protein
MPELLDIDEEAASAASSEGDLIKALVARRTAASRLSLPEEERTKLAQRVIQDFNDGVSENAVFRQLHVEMMQNWRGTPEPKDFPFPNASNIKVPMTSFFIEQMKARLIKALLGDTTVAQFSSLDESIDQATIDEINLWFDYELRETVGLEAILEDIIGSVLLDGFDLPMASYDHEEARLSSRHEFDLADDLPLDAQLLQAAQSLFTDIEVLEIVPTGKGIFQVTHLLGKGAAEHTATVTFSLDGAILLAMVERDEVVFDGVRVTSPSLENVVIINTGPDINKLPFFGLRSWMSQDEFRAAVRSGKFWRLSDEEITDVLAGAVEKQGAVVMREWSDALDIEEGTSTRDSAASDVHRRWVEIYRWEGTYDLEGTTRNIVVWLEVATQRVLRISYLEDLNKDGKRTPVKFDFIRQKDRFYSLGLAEWVRHVQAELDAIHNQRLDAGLIANVSFFFYEPGAGLNKDNLLLEPGKGYPVKDVTKVLFPHMNWSPSWSFNEESLVRTYGQEQAGLGDPAIGSMSSKRTTASEFVGTMGAIDLRTEFIVRGLLRSLRTLLWRIFGLYQQYMQDGRVYQVSGVAGERVVRQFRRERLHGKLALHLTGDVRKISAELERDVSMNMLSLLLNEMLIQQGIVKPDTIYAATEKVVRAFGYKGVPIHQPDAMPESAAPNVEHHKMMRGEFVAPSPTENFGLHLTSHMQLASDPVVETWTPEAQAILVQHIQQTQQMQQQVAAMRQQQAALAGQMRGSMEAQGVRPVGVGGQQTGDQTGAGTDQEGVMGPEAPPEAMGQMQ